MYNASNSRPLIGCKTKSVGYKSVISYEWRVEVLSYSRSLLLGLIIYQCSFFLLCSSEVNCVAVSQRLKNSKIASSSKRRAYSDKCLCGQKIARFQYLCFSVKQRTWIYLYTATPGMPPRTASLTSQQKSDSWHGIVML